MSGGSYDYLCFRDEGDIFSHIGNLRDMAARLDEVCPEAAAETRALFDGPRSLMAELEARIKRLTDLWKAVEWRDSSDWTDAQLAQAVEQFRAQGPAASTLVDDAARTQEITRLTTQAARLLAEAESIGMRTWSA